MRKTRVIVPTVYHADCPTVRSRLFLWSEMLVNKSFEFTFLILGDGIKEVCPGITYWGYKNYLDLIRIVLNLRKEDYDIILSCKPYSISGVLPYLMSRIRRMGYLLDVDDRIFPSEINKWWRLPLYVQEWCAERLMMWMKPLTVVASRALKDYWGDHVEYVPNTVKLSAFSRHMVSSNAIKENFGIHGPVVVWPAVFFQEIDRTYVLEIFDFIQKMRKGIALLVLGSGDYLASVKATAHQLRLSNVHFGGAVDHGQMPSLYASADAGILPLRNNHYDACKGPIKLYEYMAMELPVIATPIGEPREMVEKAHCGILIPFDNPAKAAMNIIELLESGERLKQLGRNGRAYLEHHQSLQAQAERIENMLLMTQNQMR